MLIYLLIFISKIVENALGTVRIIVITKERKTLGALLNGIISLIWIINTSMVLINIKDMPLKILFFCLGSIIGSYLGSIIEERMQNKKTY